MTDLFYAPSRPSAEEWFFARFKLSILPLVAEFGVMAHSMKRNIDIVLGILLTGLATYFVYTKSESYYSLLVNAIEAEGVIIGSFANRRERTSDGEVKKWDHFWSHTVLSNGEYFTVSSTHAIPKNTTITFTYDSTDHKITVFGKNTGNIWDYMVLREGQMVLLILLIIFTATLMLWFFTLTVIFIKYRRRRQFALMHKHAGSGFGYR